MKQIIILGVAAGLASCLGFAAQPAEKPDLQVQRNCQTTIPPEQDQGHATATAKPDDKLSQSLENCRGVLRPPSVGDDMAVPPPQSGAKTPVLPPGSVPQQTPKG